MTDALASVFAQGRYVGAILHRGCKGFEAVSEDNISHGCFPSQKEAAAALQQMATHSPCDLISALSQLGQKIFSE
jgi:hypothetical protein